MTTLGTVLLSDHLILDGLESDVPLAMSVRRTMGGRAVVQSLPLTTSGRELTLSGDKHFTLADIQAVRAQASLNQSVQLIHYRGTFQVLVSRIAPEQVIESAEPESDHLYSAVVYMVEV